MPQLSRSYFAKMSKDGESIYEEINGELDNMTSNFLSTLLALCGENEASRFDSLIHFWTPSDGSFFWTNDEVLGVPENTYVILIEERLAKRLKSEDNECKIIQFPKTTRTNS
jgi:hypothetical protein